MTPTQRLLPFLAALCLTAACADAVAPTRELEITPAQASISVSQAQATGIPATFTNHTAAAVTLLSTTCLGGRITMERAVPGGWVPLPVPQIVCAASTIMAPVTITVAAGASVSLSAGGPEFADLTPGRYRMHVRTTGGEAYSGTLTIK